jgi:porin
MLYRSPVAADNGVHLFSRVAISPPDRNQIDFYAEGGLTFSGLSVVRPDDVLAVGLAYTHISHDAAAYDRDAGRFSGVDSPVRDFELLLELNYTFRVASGWSVQPDFQYYWHPGGNVANPLAPDGAVLENVAVFGLRSTVHY